MMVVIHSDLRCPMTAPSMTHLSSLSETLLVNCICSLDCVFSLIHQTQDDVAFINSQSTWFGVGPIRMGRMTLAHAQTNYHVSKYSH
jgi:hypothetical protein